MDSDNLKPNAGAHRRPSGRLLVRFALATLFAFLAVGVLLHVRVAGQVRQDRLWEARSHAVFAVQHVLGPNLTEADLTEVVTGSRYDQLQALVVTNVRIAGVRRVKIWRPDGTVLFSDDPALVGQRFPEEADELRESLKSSRSGVSNLSAAENVDDRHLGASMFETYVPLSPAAGGSPIAIGEIYEDHAPAEAAANRFLRTLDLSLGGGLLVLYGILLSIAYRTSRFLQRQASRLRDQAAAVKLGQRRFRALVQGAVDLITVVDDTGRVGYQSPGIAAVLGHNADAVIGENLLDLIHPADRAMMAAALAARHAGDTGVIVPEARWRHANGTWRYIESIVSDLRHEPSVRGLALNSRDVTDRRELERQLSHQAFHDPLTGLPNRVLFRDRLEHAALRLAGGDDRTLGVLFVDVDNFKGINDGIGHAAGDQALVAVAQRLQSALRPEDTLARLGGDEFAVLLEDLTDPEDAVATAERLIEAMLPPVQIDGRAAVLGASIGVVTGTDGDADTLLRSADVAMYRAKATGKGRFVVFAPEMNTAAERLRLEADLRDAVERDEFVLHYQPIYHLETNRLVGVEALVRWQHPTRGLVPPLDFIPIAEETGLIVAIGRGVLDVACRQAQSWLEQYALDPDFQISVNVSPRQVSAGLADTVEAVLRSSGLPARRLVLEITENLVMDQVDGTMDALNAVRRMGVSVAIDDFGTGYSSLSYLQQFPVDILKIDKSFVDRLNSTPEAEQFIRAIVQLGQALGLRTVAEGIEHHHQTAPLQAAACERGQGYLYSRPLPAGAISALFAQVDDAGADAFRAPDRDHAGLVLASAGSS